MEPKRHTFLWDLQYLNDCKKFVVPAGWPGCAAYCSLRVVSGTLTSALKLQRWSPAGNHDFASARTVNATTQTQLTADDLQAVQMLALVNPASQSCVVMVDLTIEQRE